MENYIKQGQELQLLAHLGNLRKMMVQHHELENLSEFVLHEVCSTPAFELTKAAYFVNNPDFNLLQGIAGYDVAELYIADRWEHQRKFSNLMKQSIFNQQVRSHIFESFKKGEISEQYAARKIADLLGFKDFSYHAWDLKHGNHGLLIYQSPKVLEKSLDHLHDALYYLSFCPVF